MGSVALKKKSLFVPYFKKFLVSFGAFEDSDRTWTFIHPWKCRVAIVSSHTRVLANLSAPLPNPPSPSDWPLHALILSPSCLPATARLQTPFPPPLPPTPILPPCPLQSCDPAAPEQFGRLLYLLSKLWLTPVTRPLPGIVPITSSPPLRINFACLALLLLCRPFGLAAL